MRLAAIASLALLVGCCSLPVQHSPEAFRPKVYSFHVDKALTPYAVQFIRDACDKWEQYSGGRVVFELQHDLEDNSAFEAITATLPSIVAVKSDADGIVDFEKAQHCNGCMTLGLTYRAPEPPHPVIFLVMDRLENPRDFYDVVMHELGHAIGLDHIPARDSIMYAHHSPSSPNCPHQADMAEFCRVYGCELKDVKWCE